MENAEKHQRKQEWHITQAALQELKFKLKSADVWSTRHLRISWNAFGIAAKSRLNSWWGPTWYNHRVRRGVHVVGGVWAMCFISQTVRVRLRLMRLKQAGELYCHLYEAMQRREQLTGRRTVLPFAWGNAETWTAHRQEYCTAKFVRQSRDVSNSQAGERYCHLCEAMQRREQLTDRRSVLPFVWATMQRHEQFTRRRSVLSLV